MEPNEFEIRRVSELKPYDRYKYFIKKVADFEELWTLHDRNDELTLSDIDQKTFVSFWPFKSFIKSNLSNGWEMCEPFKITLDQLESSILPIVAEQGYLMNIFPVDGKSGFVVSVSELTRDLNEELEQYKE